MEGDSYIIENFELSAHQLALSLGSDLKSGLSEKQLKLA